MALLAAGDEAHSDSDPEIFDIVVIETSQIRFQEQNYQQRR